MVQITIGRDGSLAGPQKFVRRGITFERPLPASALPDCETCPKPELGPINSQTVWLYSKIADQQQYNQMSGHVQGLRFEALVAAVQWYTASGDLDDPDEVMRRVGIIDRVAGEHRNRMVDARASKPS